MPVCTWRPGSHRYRWHRPYPKNPPRSKFLQRKRLLSHLKQPSCQSQSQSHSHSRGKCLRTSRRPGTARLHPISREGRHRYSPTTALCRLRPWWRIRARCKHLFRNPRWRLLHRLGHSVPRPLHQGTPVLGQLPNPGLSRSPTGCRTPSMLLGLLGHQTQAMVASRRRLRSVSPNNPPVPCKTWMRRLQAWCLPGWPTGLMHLDQLQPCRRRPLRRIREVGRHHRTSRRPNRSPCHLSRRAM